MTLYTLVESNRRKTWFFLLFFSLLFLMVGWGFSYYYNSISLLLIFAVIVMVQGWVSYYHSDSIALLTAQAVPADDVLPPEQLKRVSRILTNLCLASGLPEPRLFVIPDTAMNAFAAGRDKDHSVLAVTAGLVSNLNDNELSGVMAHELGHIGNEDIRLMGMVMVMAGLIALVSDFFLRTMHFRGRSNRDGDSILLIVALIFAILAPLAATMIQLAISRKREFMADATGVLITRYPDGLINALKKISQDMEPLEVANRGNAHLYFANPLKSQFMAGLFSTHPPIEERIAALEQGSR